MYLRTYGQLRVDRRNHVSNPIDRPRLGFLFVDVMKTGRSTSLSFFFKGLFRCRFRIQHSICVRVCCVVGDKIDKDEGIIGDK